MRPEYRRFPPGGLVCLEGDYGARLGTFMFNPHSLIAARLLDRDPDAAIDAAWLSARLAAAISLRTRFCAERFHRLAHAEADQLPGLVIDRYADVAVLAGQYRGHGTADADYRRNPVRLAAVALGRGTQRFGRAQAGGLAGVS